MPKLGDVQQIGRKYYAFCERCDRWVRIKGALGTKHLCRR